MAGPEGEQPAVEPGSDRRFPMTDLVRAARAGAPEAFEQIVRSTYDDALNLARRLMGNEDDACDVVQDAYLRAQRGLLAFRGEARFTTWLYRIVTNCALTAQQRRSRQRHDELTDDFPLADLHPDRDPELRAGRSAERGALVSAVGSLPERLRAVVVLRDVYDQSHEAIASQLGISVTAAKVRLHRARIRLRSHFAGIDKSDHIPDGSDSTTEEKGRRAG